MNSADKNQPAVADPKKPLLPVKIVHTKSGQYKILHADGVWGAITNQGNLMVDFYVEHFPVPSSVVFPLRPDGSVSNTFQEIHTETDGSHFTVMHEFQSGVVLSVAAAIQLHQVLGSFIQNTKEMAELQIKAMGQKNE